uniref:ShKT domain-containing protein n=1 Tax=Strongyloides papillosus TaxID=174720 RepID=A0A0N5BH38_STREA
MAQSIEKPPSVYSWIEENSYICTFVTMDDQPEITFLSEDEGSECSSCPEVPAHLVPRQACATIKRPKDDIVHISCQPLPELCVIEFRNRYSEFFQRVEKNFEKHLLLKNVESQNKSMLLPSLQFNDTMRKNIPSTTQSTTTTTKVPSVINSRIININDRLKFLSSKDAIKDHITKNVFKQKSIMIKENEGGRINFMENNPSTKTSIITTTTHQELILSPPINKQFDEGPLNERNLTSNEKNIIITSFSLPSQNQSNAQLFRKNKRITNSTSTFSRNSQLLFLNNFNKTNKITEGNITKDILFYQKDNDICEDKSKICCFWALTGECTTNPFWMRINCPQACGTCGCKLKNADKCASTGIKCKLPTTTTEGTSTTTLTTTVSYTQKTTTKKVINNENEKNLDDKKINGKIDKDGNIFSTIFGGNMYLKNKNVKQIINTGITFPDRTTKTTTIKTTTSIPTTISTTTLSTSTTSKPKKLTTTTEIPCKDHHKNCKFWYLLGECTKNPFWMKTQCEKSCSTCGVDVDKIFAPTPHPGCYNHHKLCQFWSFNGECEKNPNWMLVKCKLSCRVC